MTFTGQFSIAAFPGDSISCTVDGFTVTATIYRDDDSTPPWEREDGHGPVSDWTTRDPLPGEKVLAESRHGRVFYDMAAAERQAEREQWGVRCSEHMTPSQRAAVAARVDYHHLKDWCDDVWSYVGLALTVTRDGVTLVDGFDVSLWGVESNGGPYLTEVANDLLPQALEKARDTLMSLLLVAPGPVAPSPAPAAPSPAVMAEALRHIETHAQEMATAPDTKMYRAWFQSVADMAREALKPQGGEA